MRRTNFNRQLRLVLATVLMAVLASSVAPAWPIASVSAAQLGVPPIAQRVPADAYGNGDWDCMAASIAMVLQTVTPRGQGVEAASARYAEVRQAMRTLQPVDPTKATNGLNYAVAEQVVPQLTDGARSLAYRRTTSETWQQDLAAWLAAGIPPMIHISDPSHLEGAWTFGAHSIVATGLEAGYVVYNDPWDGQEHRLTVDDFAQAWGSGPAANTWYAVLLTPAGAQPPVTPTITPTAVPTLSVVEIAQRSLEAVEDTGTYRFDQFDLAQGGLLFASGEVNLRQQSMKDTDLLYGNVYYYVGLQAFMLSQGTSWSNYDLLVPHQDSLIVFLGEVQDPSFGWVLDRVDSVEGQPVHVMAATYTGGPAGEVEWELWIDQATFLPIKIVLVRGPHGGHGETIYKDFGEPVDIQVPREALEVEYAEASAEATIAQLPEIVAAYDPYALAEWLQSSPFYDDELPAGFASLETNATSSEELATGMLANAAFDTEDGDNGIGYGVYSTAVEAQAGYDDLVATVQRRGAIVTYPSGFDYPTVLTSTYVDGYGIASTVVQIGNVLVVGYSGVPGGNQGQAELNAMDLAHSGVAHLQRIIIEDSPTELPVLPDTSPAVVVRVWANENWRDTGVMVQEGDTVVIRYISGTWSALREYFHQSLRADGDSNTSTQGILSTVPYGALIGQIGDGEPFGIGMELTLQATDSGPLLLNINDGETWDNSGSLRIAIVVDPSSTSDAQPSGTEAPPSTEAPFATEEAFATEAPRATESAAREVGYESLVELNEVGRSSVTGSAVLTAWYDDTSLVGSVQITGFTGDYITFVIAQGNCSDMELTPVSVFPVLSSEFKALAREDRGAWRLNVQMTHITTEPHVLAIPSDYGSDEYVACGEIQAE